MNGHDFDQWWNDAGEVMAKLLIEGTDKKLNSIRLAFKAAFDTGKACGHQLAEQTVALIVGRRQTGRVN